MVTVAGSVIGAVLITAGTAEIAASAAAIPETGGLSTFGVAVGVKEVGEGVAAAGLFWGAGDALIYDAYTDCL